MPDDQVNLDDLMGIHEAAHLVRLTDTRIRQLRREGKFAEPVKSDLRCGPLWLRQDLIRWKETRVKKSAGRPSGKRKGPDEAELL